MRQVCCYYCVRNVGCWVLGDIVQPLGCAVWHCSGRSSLIPFRRFHCTDYAEAVASASTRLETATAAATLPVGATLNIAMRRVGCVECFISCPSDRQPPSDSQRAAVGSTTPAILSKANSARTSAVRTSRGQGGDHLSEWTQRRLSECARYMVRCLDCVSAWRQGGFKCASC